MDYIVFTSSGSVKESHLGNRYIQQGNHNVDKIFVGYEGMQSEFEYCQAVFTLPNQTTNTELGSAAVTYDPTANYHKGDVVRYSDKTYECKVDTPLTGEEWNPDHWEEICEEPGWVITLTNRQTIYNGLLFTSLRIIKVGIVQVTFPFTLVINETGVKPDTDSGVTIEELDSYLQNMQHLVTESVQSNTDSALSLTSKNPVQNKIVTAALTHIEEVAEGKCKSFVLSFNAAAPVSDAQAQALKRVDGTSFTDLVDFTTYISSYTLGNGSFNDQNNTINLTDKYLIDISGTVYRPSDLFDIYKVGDIFLITETLVPDRWISEKEFSTDSYILTFGMMETAKIDLTVYPTLSGNNEFSGTNKFAATIYSNSIQAYADSDIKIKAYNGTDILSASGNSARWNVNVLPAYNGSQTLGMNSDSYRWGGLYLNGNIDMKSGNKIINSNFIINNGSTDVFKVDGVNGEVKTNYTIQPTTNAAANLGKPNVRFDYVYANVLSDNSTTIGISQIGKVKTVNGTSPDSSGNVQVSVSQSGLFRHSITVSGITGGTLIYTNNSSTPITSVSDIDLNKAIDTHLAYFDSGNAGIGYGYILSIAQSGSGLGMSKTFTYLKSDATIGTFTMSGSVTDTVTTL